MDVSMSATLYADRYALKRAAELTIFNNKNCEVAINFDITANDMRVVGCYFRKEDELNSNLKISYA